MRDSLRRRLLFVWLYIRGNAPWDSGIVPPEIVAWVGRAARPGRALDFGCGTGTTSLYLAERGWDVTGVDFAPNAIWRARRKAADRALAGCIHFQVGDVARDDFLRGAPPNDLLIDVGCLHGLRPDRRVPYAANAARLAAPGADYLLYAFMPHVSARGEQRGLTPDDVRALFAPSFEVLEVVEAEEATHPRPSAWYTLRRTGTQP
jgi:SAM-dependent methyltransferase